MLLENIRLAVKNFTTNKMRTLLSLLGILIGVASVILITTLGNSATADIQDEIAGNGMDVIMLYGGWGGAKSQKIFTPDLGNEIANSLNNISASTPNHETSGMAKSRHKTGNFRISCISPSYADVFDVKMAAGRFISDADSASRAPAAVLGYKTARALFPAGGAVGSPLKLIIDGKAYQTTVTGVMEKKDPIFGASFNDIILIDLAFYKSRIGRVDTVTSFFLKAADREKAEAATREIDAYLAERITEKDAYWVDSPSSLSAMFKEVTDTLNLVLSGIAAISLLVGGIGIMNIMLVSVTERTREIGVRKALGAPAGRIRSQFLTESVCLTTFGGLIGILIGSGLGKLVTGIMNWKFSPVPEAYAIAIGFSAVIGIFFGWYPAVRASKLDPIKALSYE